MSAAVAHVHKCTECYTASPCGLACELIDDGRYDDGIRRAWLDGLPQAAPCVCALCLCRAGLPPDTLMTALPGGR